MGGYCVEAQLLNIFVSFYFDVITPKQILLETVE